MSDTTGNPDHKIDALDEDLRVMAVADAVGALSERDQQKLEYREAIAEPAERQAIWDAREGVMQQMRDDLPEVEPDNSLKHRVLAKVLAAVESDLVQSTEGAEKFASPVAVVKRGLIERFVGGGVTPVWRMAALILMTISVGLFWVLNTANSSNEVLRYVVRENDLEQMEEEVGPRAINFLVDHEARQIAFKPVDGLPAARAVLAYYPSGPNSTAPQNALFIANGLPVLESGGKYYVGFDVPGVENAEIEITPSGQIVGIGFDFPNEFDETEHSWWVIRLDAQGEAMTVMESVS